MAIASIDAPLAVISCSRPEEVKVRRLAYVGRLGTSTYLTLGLYVRYLILCLLQ